MPPAPRPDFADTFATLRGMLQRQGRALLTLVDKPGDFQVASPTLTDRSGRPLFVAGVMVKKTYVSFHLLPVYMNRTLLAGLSPALTKRMQGKACFNFSTIDTDQLDELATLTKKGIDGFEHVVLPWASAAKQARKAKKTTPARARRRARA